MPIKYSKSKGKWCYGEKCIYNSRKDALKASKAVHANMKKSFDFITKEYFEDQRLFTCCVLRPNVVDAHGDIYDEVVVEKAAFDFMEHCNQGNAFHIVNTDKIKVVESWVAKTDYKFGDGEVKKGDWMMTLRILDDGLWDLAKNGELKGLSVGCKGVCEVIEDEG